MNLIVESGAVPALVRHLQAPQSPEEVVTGTIPYEHEVEKGSAFTLGLLAIKVGTHLNCITLSIKIKENPKDYI